MKRAAGIRTRKAVPQRAQMGRFNAALDALPKHPSNSECLSVLARALDLDSPEAASYIAVTACAALDASTALELVLELAPIGAAQALLAAQVTATAGAAREFLERALREGESEEFADANLARSGRLMRLNVQQIEALERLRAVAGGSR